MVMEPGFGLATVEKIAINAVMAGCRPEQFPVVLAAIDCLAATPDEPPRHAGVRPCGSAHDSGEWSHRQAGRDKLGTTAMGPGVVNSANTAIGRALRLCLINIGYCKAGAGDPNFIGLPTKFGMCIAENEETSPWQPYHVDRGFRRDESAVTVVAVTGPTTIIDADSRSPEDTLNNIASMMFYRYAGAGGWIGDGRQPRWGTPTSGLRSRAPITPSSSVLRGPLFWLRPA